MSKEISGTEKAEKRLLAQQYSELSGEPYVEPFPETPADPNKTVITPEAKKVSDDEVMAFLKEKGIAVNSIDDLKPKPTEAELAVIETKKREDRKLYGITNGKFTLDEYVAYEQAKNNKLGIIRDEVRSQLATAFPDLEEAAIEEKISNYLFEHLPEGDPMRVAREKELMEIAGNRINSKFKNIVSLDADFEQHSQGETNKANFLRKVEATLPVLKSDVEQAIASFKVYDMSIEDVNNTGKSMTIPFELPEEGAAELQAAFLSPKEVERRVKEGYTIDQIKEELELVILKKYKNQMFANLVKMYNSNEKANYLAGRKGLGAENILDIASDIEDGSPHADEYKQLLQSAQQT